jgi:hypothetical protein
MAACGTARLMGAVIITPLFTSNAKVQALLRRRKPANSSTPPLTAHG